MNDQQTIQATFWIMILLQTIGSVDLPGHGQRKMPAPRTYVLIVVLWTILGFAGHSPTWARPASRLALLLVLTGMVVGPFGSRLVRFLNTVATNWGVTQTSGRQQTTTTQPPPRYAISV